MSDESAAPVALVGAIWAATGLDETAQAAANAVVSLPGVQSAQVDIHRSDGSVELVASAGTSSADHSRARRWKPWQRDDTPGFDRELHDRSGKVVGRLSARLADGSDDALADQGLVELLIIQAGLAIEQVRLSERVRRANGQSAADREKVRLQERVWRVTFDEAPIGMSMIDLDRGDPGRIIRVNDALCRMTGFSAARLTAMTLGELTHPDDRGPTASAIRRATDGRRTPSVLSKRLLTRTGDSIWVRAITSPIFDEDQKPLYAISHIESLGERAEPDVELAARLDPVTGLLNRRALDEEVIGTLERAQRNKTTGAVMMCDLGPIEELQAQLGHADRDGLAAEMGRLLRDVLRPEDIVARVDGTTLAVVLEELSAANAEMVADRIRTALHRTVGDSALTADAAIGIAMLGTGTTESDVMRDARAAMRQARSDKTGGTVLWRADDQKPRESTRVVLWKRDD